MNPVSDRSGIVLVDKPEGMSSFAVVSRIRKILNIKKAGHAGTLDPFATGLLVIAVGRATRVLRYMENDSKVYRAVMVLGTITSTGDTEGEIIGGKKPDESELSALSEGDFGKVREAVMSMVGQITQVPSSYSAIKIAGRPAYDYARKGQEVKIPARQVTIHDITIGKITVEEGTIAVEMTVSCSKGTYIRTLCEDIGNALGFGAYCRSLRRLRSGEFTIDEACTLEKIEEMERSGNTSYARDEAEAMRTLPRIEVTKKEAQDMRNGKKLDFSCFKDRMGSVGAVENARVLAMCGGQMVAVIYEEETDGTILIREERVFT
ncbi:MAG: tRNA pseudouridine(55) synthase TruB [Clostridiales bacterium]|nr:tRNA pseudouridine(55) synthase TruB [Clostridiales bacterium]